jgi:2-isopropylmalate synthase
MKKIQLFDTTLRDGSQAEGVSFSAHDKFQIAQELDRLGIHYIEGGWPGSNPKDNQFFKEAKNYKFKHSRLVAFGATRRKSLPAHEDPNLLSILEVGTKGACIFGKSWDMQVIQALRTTLPENLAMVGDSVRFLKSKGLEVLYDAEHFFDGYKANKAYALKTLEAAVKAGANSITLCDTNGGGLPPEIAEAVRTVRKKFPRAILGIHVHNDSGCAVANTLAAVEAGVTLVQGVMNGFGERCGNADLAVIIPNLQLKMGYKCLEPKQLQRLTEVSRFVYEVANMVPNDRQPYVGISAFAHKGGVHVSAVSRLPATYEHIIPDAVGNQRRILVSELSGKSNILLKESKLRGGLAHDPETANAILEKVKQWEMEGYQYEGAEASFELLVEKELKRYKPAFDLKDFRVIVERKENGAEDLVTQATLVVAVRGKEQHTVGEGDGPVNALDNALRKALEKFYPSLSEMSLIDYKVRVINATAGTAAKVRVLIESRDPKNSWTTIGVSTNIIQASWLALVDAIEYKLFKDALKPGKNK